MTLGKSSRTVSVCTDSKLKVTCIFNTLKVARVFLFVFRELRALVVEMVLATDMSCHFQQVKAMKNFLQQPEGSVLCSFSPKVYDPISLLSATCYYPAAIKHPISTALKGALTIAQ